MAECRAAVVAAYEWFTHARTVDQFENVKAKGIPLAWPEAAFPPAELLEALGKAGQNIICLSIFPKNSILHLDKGHSSVFKMALQRDALPLRVGLDCTFGGTYDCASTMRASKPDASLGEIFLAVVRNREVVITFDAIRPDVLRICPKAEPDAPHEKWPRLVDTDFEEAAIFKPDLLGNVRL